jgi:hypothetical protein
MSIKKPSGRTITAATPDPLEPAPSKPSPLNRRAFLTGAAVLGRA